MPTISMFYGIIIRMYYAPGEHNPPHFHAYYNEVRATFSIESLDIIEGDLPRRQVRLVQAGPRSTRTSCGPICGS